MACPFGGGSGRAATTPPAQSGRPESLRALGGRRLRAALRGATARSASRSTKVWATARSASRSTKLWEGGLAPRAGWVAVMAFSMVKLFGRCDGVPIWWWEWSRCDHSARAERAARVATGTWRTKAARRSARRDGSQREPFHQGLGNGSQREPFHQALGGRVGAEGRLGGGHGLLNGETFRTLRWRAHLVVGVVALRPLRPRRAGGPSRYGRLADEGCAPLCAARRLAARAVPPLGSGFRVDRRPCPRSLSDIVTNRVQPMKNQPSSPAGETQSRRVFLKTTATAAAAVAATGIVRTPVYGQSQAPSPGRVLGANDRIAVAYIGVGNQGFGAHVTFQKQHAQENNIVQAAVCD